MFKKKRDNSDAEPSDLTDGQGVDGDLDDEIDLVDEVAVVGVDRGDGPYDSSEAPDDGMQRVDFGALQIPGVDGMSVNLEVDEENQQIVAITVVLGEAAVQLQPFAAPRSGGFWPEVREELGRGITESGGETEEVEGTFGIELRANVPAVNEQGEEGFQPVKFVGVEGPRWLLRGVMLGAAAMDERAAEVFEDIFRGCIVTRGAQPMAPGEMLALTMPEDAVSGDDLEMVDDDADGDERPSLDPFERGPEITEIR
ncbi:MAG: DUF3710 domain-containing protein [Candidatus Nanopelagicales bacterium]